jgi:thymidylate kinase
MAGKENSMIEHQILLSPIKKPLPIIHIIGLPGAGKTSLSQRLSKLLKIPILRIGCHRAQFPTTFIGEADAWVALFRELSRRRWKNCILETTGLNSREEFLRKALPFERIFTIKLEASRETLIARIRKKKKKERGGKWLYSTLYRNKYEFVRKLFKQFRKIPANFCINTNRLAETAVCQQALNGIEDICKLKS